MQNLNYVVCLCVRGLTAGSSRGGNGDVSPAAAEEDVAWENGSIVIVPRGERGYGSTAPSSTPNDICSSVSYTIFVESSGIVGGVVGLLWVPAEFLRG